MTRRETSDSFGISHVDVQPNVKRYQPETQRKSGLEQNGPTTMFSVVTQSREHNTLVHQPISAKHFATFPKASPFGPPSTILSAQLKSGPTAKNGPIANCWKRRLGERNQSHFLRFEVEGIRLAIRTWDTRGNLEQQATMVHPMRERSDRRRDMWTTRPVEDQSTTRKPCPIYSVCPMRPVFFTIVIWPITFF